MREDEPVITQANAYRHLTDLSDEESAAFHANIPGVPMTPDDLDRLRRLAEAATKGPWFTVGPPWLPSDQCPYVIAGSDDPHVGRLVCDLDFVEDRDQPNNSEADADYIAAANPATVLRLLDRIAELEAERGRLVAEELAACAWVCDSADKGTHPADLADRIRARASIIRTPERP